jgi:g-D-glutamyl-meso-diaminopimelate peptidase
MVKKEFNTVKNLRKAELTEFTSPVDYRMLMKTLQSLSDKYPFVGITYIGTSVLGRGIPMVTMGDGDAVKKSVLYVGCHHGMEWITSAVLLRFIEEYCTAYENGYCVCNVNVRKLFNARCIYVIPQLNVDGADIQINSVEGCILKDRLITMNCGDDFSDWQANARGVDLNHNYDAYFDEYKVLERENNITYGRTRYSGDSPESEPEVSALANYIRFHEAKLDGILTFHTQGEEIYYKSRGKEIKRASYLAEAISRFTRYKVSEAEGLSSFGGLTDWFIKEFDKPSFTLECGKGDNPLDISYEWDIYCRLRELMYNFPILL